LIHEMMRTIMAASKVGDLALAAPMITLAGKAMNVKPSR
jgi:hypothetical protein